MGADSSRGARLESHPVNLGPRQEKVVRLIALAAIIVLSVVQYFLMNHHGFLRWTILIHPGLLRFRWL